MNIATYMINFRPIVVNIGDNKHKIIFYEKDTKELVPNMIPNILQGIEIDIENYDDKKPSDEDIIDL